MKQPPSLGAKSRIVPLRSEIDKSTILAGETNEIDREHTFLSAEAGLLSDEVLRSPFMAWETRSQAGANNQLLCHFLGSSSTSFCLSMF
jgi:hypothetical protein